MCGICGAVSLSRNPMRDLGRALGAMSQLIAHRGPDGHGFWRAADKTCGFAHRRLAIIDTTETGRQPMIGPNGAVIVHNGEIFNYVELTEELRGDWRFRSHSDTETIVAAYDRWGPDCVAHLRGMFAFALWDGNRLFAARDRFGIKPFYYAIVNGIFYFASEIKALLPILPEIESDPDALAEYLVFQYTLGERSLFKHVHALPPGHTLMVENGEVRISRYWDLHFNIDFDHQQRWFEHALRGNMEDSIALHLRADVPVGAYLSGGVDSSLIAMLSSRAQGAGHVAFHGKFTKFPDYDESAYAEVAARAAGLALHQVDITARDFSDNIEKVIYHLDHPVAGPGSLPQYMVSGLAARHVKVVLGGQGGDEIFGGYARYLIAYFEQCIAAAIDGTYNNGNYVVTAESIIPHLNALQEYKPLLRRFFSDGMFGPLDARYFRLIDRSADMKEEIDWPSLDRAGVFDRFRQIFNSERNVRKEAYFDSMTHFDFKCLLPALLQVEDRMSMAHGLESRVPFLDVPLVELAATIPANFKFKDGQLKYFLKTTFRSDLPAGIVQRRDKMGFPVPLDEWFSGELRDFVRDIFATQKARHRPFINTRSVVDNLENNERFSRKLWALLCLELWCDRFHDRVSEFRRLLNEGEGMLPADEMQAV